MKLEFEEKLLRCSNISSIILDKGQVIFYLNSSEDCIRSTRTDYTLEDLAALNQTMMTLEAMEYELSSGLKGLTQVKARLAKQENLNDLSSKWRLKPLSKPSLKGV